MADFNDFNSSVANATSNVTGVINGIASNVSAEKSAKKAYQYNKKLLYDSADVNKQMWDYTYDKQRADKLSDILNSASWEVQAKKRAGLSTATDKGESAATSSAAQGATPDTSPSSASAGSMSVPYVDWGQQFEAASRTAANAISSQKAQAETDKVRSETEGQNIENDTKNARNIEQLELMRKQGKINDVQFNELSRQYEYNKSVQEFKRKQEENARIISDNKVQMLETENEIQRNTKELGDIAVRLKEEERKQAEFVTLHQEEEFKARMSQIQADIFQKVQSGKLSIAQASQAYATASFIAVQQQGQEYANALEKEKIPYAPQAARAWCNQMRNNVSLSYYKVQSAMAQAGIDQYSNSMKEFDYWQSFVRGSLLDVSAAASNVANCFKVVGGSAAASSTPKIQTQTSPLDYMNATQQAARGGLIIP